MGKRQIFVLAIVGVLLVAVAGFAVWQYTSGMRSSIEVTVTNDRSDLEIGKINKSKFAQLMRSLEKDLFRDTETYPYPKKVTIHFTNDPQPGKSFWAKEDGSTNSQPYVSYGVERKNAEETTIHLQFDRDQITQANWTDLRLSGEMDGQILRALASLHVNIKQSEIDAFVSNFANRRGSVLDKPYLELKLK